MTKIPIRYKHFAPSGDLLSCLPGMRRIYRDTGRKAIIMQRLNVPIFLYDNAIHHEVDIRGNAIAMSKKQWDMLVPLLESQEYVERCEIWEGQEAEINLDQIREGKYTPMPNGDLYFWQPLAIPQMMADFSKPWLSIQDTKTDYDGKIVINRTERYTNPLISYFFLREYQDECIFVGTHKEHIRFCEEWGLAIKKVDVDNFLQLAQIIKNSRVFIGNQSMCYHIAEGMAAKRLLEICPAVANVWPHTPNGTPFMHEGTFDFLFKKAIGN